MSAPVFATHGCRLNAYETEAMKELAAAAGLRDAVIMRFAFDPVKRIKSKAL